MAIVQPASAQTAEVTGVVLSPVEGGVEIILEGTGSEASEVIPTRDGKTYSAEITNTQLRLESGEDFRQESPVDGIDSVSIEPLGDTSVRVTVIGETIIPTVDITPTPEGFFVNATTTSPFTAQQPITPNEGIRVVVTAEKTEAEAQDVPISLTVFTAEELEDADVDSFEDIAGNTPNFSVFSSGGNRNTISYSLRGLSNADNFASRDTVGFFIDDVPYDFSNFIGVDLSDLERVEVLRGPQNTLYGRSSQGGVVNVITRNPSERFEFNTNFSYGTYDDTDIGASMSIPIIQDELGIRLSGSYNLRDGYVYNRFLDDDLGDQSGGRGRAKLVWTPNDQWEVSMNTSFDDYQDGALPLTTFDADPFTTSANFNGFNELTTNTQALKVAYENSSFRATSITTRRFSRQAASADADLSALDVLRVSNEFDSTVWSQEVRFQSPSDIDRLAWIAGAYFESRDFGTQDDGLNFGTAAPFLNPSLITGSSQLSNASTNQTTYALFGQTSYRPIERLNLTAGLRYEISNSTLEEYQDIFSIPGFPDTILTSFEDVDSDSSAILPRFALTYDFTDNITAYSSIARGYKPAGVNFRPDSALDTVTFDEELSWNYEVGVKTVWLDDRLGANFSFFYNPIRDYQLISVDAFDNVEEIANADAEVIGVEFELKATPIEGLDLIAGLGYADSRLQEFTNAVGQNLDNNRITFVPDVTYNLAAQYRHTKGFFGRLELQGYGSTFFDTENTLKQDPYAVVNARLGYEYQNYGFYVFANNIFNTEYATNISELFGSRVGSLGVPATVGFQIRTKLR